MTELVFVMAHGQNAFFAELVEALRDELDELGVPSSLALDAFPQQRRGLVNILLPPHEYFALRGGTERPEPSLLRRTVFICAEQPGSQWFQHNVRLAKEAGAVMDINAWGAREWVRGQGVAAEHLPVGWTRRWDRSPLDGERNIDVAFLGSHSDRRARHLAGYASSLWRWRANLLLSDGGRPNTAASPDFVVGEQKRDLLARTRVLLNLHATEFPYFESLRIVESIHCGAVVVSEHSALTRPFLPGHDYWSASPASLMLVAQELLEDEDRRRQFATEALERLRSKLPLRSSAERLAAVANEVDRTARIGSPAAGPAPPATDGAPPDPADEESVLRPLRRRLKRTRLDLIRSRRRLERLELRLAGLPAAGIDVAVSTPAWAGAVPRVSVIVPLYDYEHFIEAALDSVAASAYRAVELIVIDDASTDASLAHAVAWCERNPEMAAKVLHQRSNRGLPHARNAGLEAARGEFAFMLDADNAVYPHCLGRLVQALDDHPDAAFAYGMAERYDESGPEGLLSVFGWDVARLREMNYIDAMALIRVSVLRELQGYSDDIRLYGWEDYDFWCKVAERGWHGHAVREILARYRVTSGSMLASITSLSGTDAYVALAARHPRLMAEATPPP